MVNNLFSILQVYSNSYPNTVAEELAKKAKTVYNALDLRVAPCELNDPPKTWEMQPSRHYIFLDFLKLFSEDVDGEYTNMAKTLEKKCMQQDSSWIEMQYTAEVAAFFNNELFSSSPVKAMHQYFIQRGCISGTCDITFYKYSSSKEIQPLCFLEFKRSDSKGHQLGQLTGYCLLERKKYEDGQYPVFLGITLTNENDGQLKVYGFAPYIIQGENVTTQSGISEEQLGTAQQYVVGKKEGSNEVEVMGNCELCSYRLNEHENVGRVLYAFKTILERISIDPEMAVNKWPLMLPIRPDDNLDNVIMLGRNSVLINRKVVKVYDYFNRRMNYRRNVNYKEIKDALKDRYLPNAELDDKLKNKDIWILTYDYVEGHHSPKNINQLEKVVRDLKTLHENDIVHGDVRFANIVFGKDGGSAYLIDYDFAAKINENPRYPKGYVGREGGIEERHKDASSLEYMHMKHDTYSMGQIVGHFIGKKFDENTKLDDIIKELENTIMKDGVTAETGPITGSPNDENKGGMS